LAVGLSLIGTRFIVIKEFFEAVGNSTKSPNGQKCQEPLVRNTRRAGSRQTVPDTFFSTRGLDLTDQSKPSPGWLRIWPSARSWNVALRTAHIAVAGALFGGHVFGVSAERLIWWLYPTLVTGAVLSVLEAYPTVSWCHEARGLCVIAKIVLLCCIPWLWEYRALILVVVITIGSVGSHMPRRFRHYSFLYRRVME